MVLTNASYFNASWSYPFNESNTRNRPFYLLDDDSIQIPMMRTAEEFLYTAGDGYQVVDLPYVGHEMSMTIMVPDRGRFREFENSLDVALVDRIIRGLESRLVTLDMPKFQFESQFRLGETLKSMGMADAFDSSTSDFSGMNGRSCLAGDEGMPLHSGGNPQDIRCRGRGGHRGCRGNRRGNANGIRSTRAGQRNGGQALRISDSRQGDRGHLVCRPRWRKP